MTRAGCIFIGLIVLPLAGCAGRTADFAVRDCSDHTTSTDVARVCETPTTVTIEHFEPRPAPIVARDPEQETPDRILGLAHGETAERLVAASRKPAVRACGLDRRRLKDMLARKLVRKLLADL
jgi:hypothetical protein